MPDDPVPNSIVILVHGTYASDPSDVGDAWWQAGSPCWRELQKRLPADLHLADVGEVFHWSGENSERARSKAAADLFRYLQRLEQQGRSYHLVGHSHGGSVIAGALRLAELRRQPMERLGSWTTVGTPNLHARTRSIWNPLSLVNIVVAIALITPLSRSTYQVGDAIFAAAARSEVHLVVPHHRGAGYAALMQRPVLALVESLGVPVEEVDDGLKLGSYDPNGKTSFAAYLFLSREGLTLLGVSLLKIYILAYFTAVCVSPILESLRIGAEQKLEQKTADRYATRWLGLWSTADEAINGLRATIDFSVSFVGRLTPRERVFFSDNLSLVTRPYFWLLGPIYNRTVRPLIDGKVRRLIVRTAQGNNRPAAEVVQVSPLPFLHGRLEACPALPEKLDARLVDNADKNARDIAPKLRRLIAETPILAGLETFGHTLSGKELVHTSYFEASEILDLIAMNIRWSQRPEADLTDLPIGSYETADWFAGFKRSLGAVVHDSRQVIHPKIRQILFDPPPSRAAS